MMCASVLTGCNLFGTDLETYYNAVVASINFNYELNGKTVSDRLEITKRELINAYNSYGYNYVNNYNYTQEEAIDITLNTIINRELMIRDVEVQAQKEGKELFNDREKSYLWQETYDAIYENLRAYYNEVLGIEEDEETSSEEESGVYQKYQPSATYYKHTQDGQVKYEIKKTTPVATVSGNYEILKNNDGLVYDYEYEDKDGNQIFQELIYETLKAYMADTNWKTAFNKYIQTVRDNYSYVKFEDDDEVFYFELDRIYDIVRDNYVVEKYEELYNKAAENGSTLTGVRVDNILDYYVNEVKADYDLYRDDPETFETDVLSSSTNVHYVYSGENATNYFNVGVIKLSFKDGQKTPEDLEKEINSGEVVADEDYIEGQLNSIYNALYADIKDEKTGKSTGRKISASGLLKEIQTLLSKDEYKYVTYEEVSQSNQKMSEEEVKAYVDEKNQSIAYARADAFIKYLYYYNDDTTFQNSDKTAVFGVNGNEVVYNETFSGSQNEAFDEALKKLYNNGNAQVGDLSDLIRTDDGVYILFYAGEVESLFENITSEFSLTFEDIEKLGSTRVNIFNNKTYFDLLYEAVYVENNFDNFEAENLEHLKRTLTKADNDAIVKYPDNYKDLF